MYKSLVYQDGMALFFPGMISSHRFLGVVLWRVTYVRRYAMWIQFTLNAETREVDFLNADEAWEAYDLGWKWFEAESE